MGICSSCLGSRRRDSYDDDDEAQRLFDDPNGMHYGSFESQQMGGQDDPHEVQREIEALQQVVARTSDNMVDIYEIAPQDKAMRGSPAHHPPYENAGQDARLARYQTLLTRLSARDDVAAVTWVDWAAPEDEPIEIRKTEALAPTVKLEGANVLVGNFADAVAAMR